MVEIFNGKEINNDKIEIIKDITFKRYPKEIYDDYFNSIEDVEDLAYLHDISIDNENLAIGTDWFLCYSESDYYVKILEWVSIDNGNKVQQVAEMIVTLKKIFLKNSEKTFLADMRHDTSYAMYLKMLRKGYFKEWGHEYIIDCAAPRQVEDLKIKFMNEFNSIKDFLASDISLQYTEYFKYILHHLIFTITDKFVEKCNPQEHILKIKK